MPGKTTLRDVLSQKSLKEFAGVAYYRRGVEYFENNTVYLRGLDDQTITARVEGSDTYQVTIKVRRNELDWSCSCPLGDEGAFCKHVVAIGLAWLDRKPAKPVAEGSGASYETPGLAGIREFLAKADKQTLSELLLKQAAQDDQFANKLISTSLRRGSAKPAKLKAFIRAAFDVGDFVDYHEASASSRSNPISAHSEMQASPNTAHWRRPCGIRCPHECKSRRASSATKKAPRATPSPRSWKPWRVSTTT